MISHSRIEKNSILMIVLSLLVVSIGGLIEIVPLYYLDTTIEKVKGMRPYSPLELAGRNIYIREGCYNCHSQMVRPFRDEIERYGHYSLAAESMYDRPFQWGSKRTGPDLARVGGKYSDDWHVAHLVNPRSVVPESIMPGYPFLLDSPARIGDLDDHLSANAALGVPYTDDMIALAESDAFGQANPDSDQNDGIDERYPNAVIRDFDGNPGAPSEMDALVAYLQVLGQMVDFSAYKAEENLR
jgi:cytochrome c oxidase cbb3-type subunit 2